MGVELAAQHGRRDAVPATGFDKFGNRDERHKYHYPQPGQQKDAAKQVTANPAFLILLALVDRQTLLPL